MSRHGIVAALAVFGSGAMAPAKASLILDRSDSAHCGSNRRIDKQIVSLSMSCINQCLAHRITQSLPVNASGRSYESDHGAKPKHRESLSNSEFCSIYGSLWWQSMVVYVCCKQGFSAVDLELFSECLQTLHLGLDAIWQQVWCLVVVQLVVYQENVKNKEYQSQCFL